MFNFMTVVRALADETRVRILMTLSERELCVCQITAVVDLAPSTTSKHLSLLRQARLIEGRKYGKWVYYSLSGNSASPMIKSMLELLRHHLAADPFILQDKARVESIIQAEIEKDGASSLRPGADTCHSPEIHAMAEENGGEL